MEHKPETVVVAKFQTPGPEMPCSYLNFAEENLHKTWQPIKFFFVFIIIN